MFSKRCSLPHWTSLFVIGLCLLTLNSFAADRVLNIGELSNEPVSLTPYFSVLEDVDGSLTFADVQSDAMAHRFIATHSAKRTLNFGITSSAYWLKLRIANLSTAQRDSMLEIYYPRLAEVDFYRLSNGMSTQIVRTGFARPFADRAYEHRFFILPISMVAESWQTIYVRVKSPTSLEVPAQLWTKQAFHTYEILDHMTQATYFGMFLAMAMFNILLWISLRERGYLFYVLFSTSIAVALASSTGVGMQYLWRDAPAGWTSISFAVAGHLGLVWLISFARHVISTATLVPRLDQGLKLAIWLNVILACTNFIAYTSKISATMIALSSLLLLVCAVIGAIRGQRSAILFSIAFLVLLIGSVANSLRMLGFLPVNVLTLSGIQIGSALEMIFLSFTLADRFHLLRAEKEKAQQRLVETLQNSEQVLEERVSQRTDELKVLNQRLAAISVTDSLTGIANRRRFDDVLQEEWTRAVRSKQPLALAMLDVDFFKSYNDHSGHVAGDECLRQVASLFVATVCRAGDLAARYGGEEFAFIAPLTERESALAMAQKTCDAIFEMKIPHEHSPFGFLTVSIGVSVMLPDENSSPEELLRQADQALYQAKALGRNRVVLAAIV
jgi:diguanylate cyclase (GGDEF)-like protein